MRTSRITAALAAALTLAMGTAHAATVNVSGGGGALQTAITAAKAGDVLRVAPGTYSPITTSGKAITIESTGGAAVTIIDGGGAQRCATLWPESGNAAVLTGFTLRNGYVRNSTGEPAYGGGVRGGILNNCILTGNTAAVPSAVSPSLHNRAYGGGAAHSVLNNCTLTGNRATLSVVANPSHLGCGGGAYGCELNNCTVTGNTISGPHVGSGPVVSGGGTCGGRLNNCTVTGNTASGNVARGGGAYGGTLNHCVLEGNIVVSNNNLAEGGGASGCNLNSCLLTGNSVTASNTGSGNGGGAYGCRLINCTIVGNNAATPNSSSYGNGGVDGLGVDDYGNGTVAVNCIIRGNTHTYLWYDYNDWPKSYIVTEDDNYADIRTGAFLYPSTPLIWNSCVQAKTKPSFGNNINSDPKFVNAANGNYRLQSSSPCINKGNNAFVTTAMDMDGNIRVHNNTIDMGAYECGAPAPTATYPVTFTHNWGPDPTTEVVTQATGSIYVLPDYTPERHDYVYVGNVYTYYAFSGWFTEASGGTKVPTATPVTQTGPHTLYAQWGLTPSDSELDAAVDNTGGFTIWWPKNCSIVTGNAAKDGKHAVVIKNNGSCTIEVYGRGKLTFYYKMDEGGAKTDSSSWAGWLKHATTWTQDTMQFADDGRGYCNITWAGFRPDAALYLDQVVWTPATSVSMTVTLNANGGSVSQTSKSVTSGKTYGTLPVPTRSGYEFAGWYTAQTDGVPITSSSLVSQTSNHTLWARWALAMTVTYNANGGTVASTSKTVLSGQACGTLPVPTRTGYDFAGWYTTASTGGTQVTAATTITQNQTLYARWTAKTFTVTLNGNSGSPASQTTAVTYDGTYGALPSPTRAGYAFTGWWTAKTGGTKVTGDTAVSITANQTLYAQWVVYVNTYDITFNAGAGSVATGSMTVNESYAYGMLPVPTRADHAFLGWYTAPDGGGVKVTAASVVTLSEPHTLYANWIYAVMDVTFNVNGGTSGNQSGTQMFGGRYAFPPDPVREGYTFLGWFANSAGTGSPVTASSAVTETTVFYAKWVATGAVPTVYAMADGPGAVTVSPANGQVVNGKAVTLTAKPDKDALFVDWSSGEETATIKVAPAGDTVYVARFRVKSACETPEVEDIIPSDNAMVGVPFSMQVEINDAAKPVKFSAAKLPAGLKIDAATGVISGVPTKAGTFSGITVKAVSVADGKKFANADIPAITIEALPWNAQGTFTGSVWDEAGEVCGSLTATVSAMGKLSAKVIATSGAWSFSAPSWTDRAGSYFTVSAKAGNGQTLELNLDVSDAWDTEQMYGELDGSGEIWAQRNPFLNKNDDSYTDALDTLKDTYKGYYTMLLSGSAETNSTLGAAKNEPEGYGYLTATVNDKGSVKLAGKLADGTAVSASTTLLVFPDRAEIPCFAPLYGKKGFYSDRIEVNATNSVVEGSGTWLYPGKTPAGKTPAVEDRFMAYTFAEGARYNPLARLADYYAGLDFFAEHDAFAEILDDGRGGIVVPKGKAPKYDREYEDYEYDEENPNVVTFKANKATGLFSGKFNIYEELEDAKGNIKLKTTSASYQGVLVQGNAACADGGCTIGEGGSSAATGSGYGAGFYLLSETWESGDAKPVKYTIKRSYPVNVD